jgi:hypothetical protein
MTQFIEGDSTLLNSIRGILNQARNELQRTVNHTMVKTYWQVGCLIIEHEQQGEKRAVYGQYQLKQLAEELQAEFGKGFNERNLRRMRTFYQLYPIWTAVRSELSWTHYRILLSIENQEARKWYTQECIEQNWSARALERQISKLYYERLLASKDKAAVIREAQEHTKGLRINPKNYLRDPYVLDFLNLPYTSLLEAISNKHSWIIYNTFY